jgi:hypothetical protein
MKNYISIFVISFILISSNSTLAQGVDQQNLIKAPGTFVFNTANSITGNITREEYDSDGDDGNISSKNFSNSYCYQHCFFNPFNRLASCVILNLFSPLVIA